MLDVRYLEQLTENEIDHKAFVPVIQYKKGAIPLLSYSFKVFVRVGTE